MDVGGIDMGKSILKKILAVFLTVAIIVGIIEIPPLVKADALHPESVTFTGMTTMREDVTFTFRINEPNPYYNAQAQRPSISISAIEAVPDGNGGTVNTELCPGCENVTASTADFDIVYEEAVNASDNYYSVTISGATSGRFVFDPKILYFRIQKILCLRRCRCILRARALCTLSGPCSGSE